MCSSGVDGTATLPVAFAPMPYNCCFSSTFAPENTEKPDVRQRVPIDFHSLGAFEEAEAFANDPGPTNNFLACWPKWDLVSLDVELALA